MTVSNVPNPGQLVNSRNEEQYEWSKYQILLQVTMQQHVTSDENTIPKINEFNNNDCNQQGSTHNNDEEVYDDDDDDGINYNDDDEEGFIYYNIYK